jgi:hypothetical protein
MELDGKVMKSERNGSLVLDSGDALRLSRLALMSAFDTSRHSDPSDVPVVPFRLAVAPFECDPF